MHRSRPTVVLAIAAVLGLMAAACGGGADGDADDPAATTMDADEAALDDGTDTEEPDTTEPDTTDADTDASDGDDQPDTGDTGESGDTGYTPGDDLIRVVNLLDDPIDVYVRTTDGMVNAYLVQAGVGPGEVTEYFSPPDPGVVAVLDAGASDAECVATCPHIFATIRTSDDTGHVITSVLYVDEFTDEVRSFEAWEVPVDSEFVAANRMPEPDPSVGLVVPLASALREAQFGLRMAHVGVAGCQVNTTESNLLVGGTATDPYAYDGPSVEIVFHDNSDSECVEATEGGPFTVTGGPGTRTLLVLTGEPGDMDAIEVPLFPVEADDGAMVDSDGDGATSDGAAADAEAIAATLGDFLAVQLPLSDTEAACLAELIVDRVGADVLTTPDGDPIDFAIVDPDVEDALVGAMIAGIGLCDIDPMILE